ncbi:MAG: hypothetical protein M9894_03960 [Planctomycetes bacterium]|nr:hypothetical protein [Planctomycetota bacterium]
MSLELRERDIGQLLAQIFSFSADQFGRLFILQCIAGLPVLVAQLVLQPGLDLDLSFGGRPEELAPVVGAFYGKLLIVAVVAALFLPIEVVAASLLVQRLVDGQPPDLPGCLREALRRWPRCLLLTVTLGVIVALGAMCCMVPGVVFSIWFFVVVPVFVIERTPWTGAFARSRGIVGGLSGGGRFLEVLVVYLLTAFAPGMILAPIFLALTLIPSVSAQLILQQTLTMGAGVVMLAAPPLVYYHLRVTREAYDLQRICELVDVIGAQAQQADDRGQA